MNVNPIEQMRLLVGHVNPRTAHLVDDYPYGRQLRCRIRYWVETAARGPKRGQRRFVYQTTDPKRAGHPWNKPHPGTYAPLVWMYLDGRAHVRHTAVGQYGPSPQLDAWLRLCGIYQQLPQPDRDRYDMLAAAAAAGSGLWRSWHQAVDDIAASLAAAGAAPPLHNGFLDIQGQGPYIGDEHSYAVAVAAAHAKLNT